METNFPLSDSEFGVFVRNNKLIFEKFCVFVSKKKSYCLRRSKAKNFNLLGRFFVPTKSVELNSPKTK